MGKDWGAFFGDGMRGWKKVKKIIKKVLTVWGVVVRFFLVLAGHIKFVCRE